MKNSSKLALAAATVAAFTVPIFSSGLKRDLTFTQWILNHTKWGPVPMYIPREMVITQGLDYGPDEFGIRHVVANGQDQYRAMKRLNYEEYDLREWVTPDDPIVKEYSCMLWDPDPDRFTLRCWYWVCSEFPYRGELLDYWRFPTETLVSHQQYDEEMTIYSEMRLPTLPPRSPGGDCEDLSFTLASILIAGGVDAYVDIGLYGRLKHAWVTVFRNGSEYILEATLSGRTVEVMLDAEPWLPAEDCGLYCASYRFNNIAVNHLTNP